jgi:hypothetical protein
MASLLRGGSFGGSVPPVGEEERPRRGGPPQKQHTRRGKRAGEHGRNFNVTRQPSGPRS